MRHEIKHGPSFASLFLDLEAGEKIRTEAGCMVGMSPNLQIKTKAYGGLFKAIFRRLLGGESAFQNTYTAEGGPGRLICSPTMPGQIRHYPLTRDKALMMQGSSFLACDPSISMKTAYGGVKAMVSGEGLFLLKLKGEGDLFYNSYGEILEVDVDGEYVVDTGHIVAFEDTLKFKIGKVGGLKSTLLSGEGLVARFKGRGKLYIQTRTLGALLGWITPFLPVR
ncbi:MAG: TIGR00266 family protein [Deltaproteobacteria bacterium]|nr:TIGR00266 family protein [Deltaproteobacteria bacterium]